MVDLTRSRSWVVAFVVGVTVFAVHQSERDHEPAWRGGIIEHGSIQRTEHGYVFAIRPTWGWDRARLPRIVVGYDGSMPENVCDGSEVGLVGWQLGTVFRAERVHGGGDSKYDACRRWRCKPVEEWPSECRRNRFE